MSNESSVQQKNSSKSEQLHYQLHCNFFLSHLKIIMKKVISPSCHKKLSHHSKSYISTSSDSGSDDNNNSSSSSTSSTSSSSSEDAEKSIKNTTHKSPKIVTTTEDTASVAVTTIKKNTNGISIHHDEHVAILDKLSSNLREEVKRGLVLLNNCVNQLAQSKWILVNVERTLDEFYQDCPVCKSVDGNDRMSNVTAKVAETSESQNPGNEESKKEPHVHSHSKHNKTGISQRFSHHNESDGERKKSHKIILPMGRSGCNFSKNSSKYKHKSQKSSSKEQNKIKSPELITISQGCKEKEVRDISNITIVPVTSAEKSSKVIVSPAPLKRKPGPRSKTRPLEKPLVEQSSCTFEPAPFFTDMTEAQLNLLQELIKKGEDVKINLDNISTYLNGETHIKDWRKLRQVKYEGIDSLVDKKTSTTGGWKFETGKLDGSDLDEDRKLSKLKRKSEEVMDKSSKKHKTISHSHSKDRHKYTSEKDTTSSKNKRTKRKSLDDARKDRKSVDSHSVTSVKSQKTSNGAPVLKHRKSAERDSAAKNNKSEPSSRHPREEKSEMFDVSSMKSGKSVVGDGAVDVPKPVCVTASEIVEKANENVPPIKTTKSDEVIFDKNIAPQSSGAPEQVKAALVAMQKEALLKILKAQFNKFRQTQNKEPFVVTPKETGVSESGTEKLLISQTNNDGVDMTSLKFVPAESSSVESENMEGEPTQNETSDLSESLMPTEIESTTEVKTADNVPIVGSNGKEEEVQFENKDTETISIDADAKEDEITSTVPPSHSLTQDEAIEIRHNKFDEILSILDEN